MIGWTTVFACGLAALLAAMATPCHRDVGVPAAPPPPADPSTAPAQAAADATAPGLFHPNHPLGVTTGVGMIPPRLMRDFDLADWPAKAAGDAERLAASGAGWYRHHSSHFPGFDQRSLERRDFDWTYHDELVRLVQARGIDILLIIGRTNGIASCRQFQQHLPASYLPAAGDDEEAYRGYVTRVVERYDADGVDDMPGLEAPIRWFQLGNENDLHYEACQADGREYATPEQYLAMARITHEAMTAASADARLAASMTFGHVTEQKSRWTEQLLALEDGAVLEVIDALDMHDYSRDLATQRDRIAQLHELSGGRVPIWITETSVPGDPDAARGWDPQRQAAMLAPIVCQALASGHVERVFWHALHDGPPVQQSRQWRVFGTNSLYGCVEPVAAPGTPPRCQGFELKPVGRAFVLLAAALDGWSAVERLDGTRGYRVRREEGPDALVLERAGAGARSVDAAALLGVEVVEVWDLVDEGAFDGVQPARQTGAVALGEWPRLVIAAREE